jgi:hypothetical protein
MGDILNKLDNNVLELIEDERAIKFIGEMIPNYPSEGSFDSNKIQEDIIASFEVSRSRGFYSSEVLNEIYVSLSNALGSCEDQGLSSSSPTSYNILQ